MTGSSTASANGAATNGRPVALVTGAATGIGREIACLLAERGYRVIGTSRDPGRAPRDGALDGVGFLPLDLASEDSICACAEAAGPVDVLVNNAGQSQIGPLEHLPPDAVRHLFEVNVLGQIRLTQLCLPAMRARGAGAVIMIGSLMAEFPVPFQSTYAATKLALQGFVGALRTEVRPFGIKVSVIQPGYYDTPIRHNRERFGAGAPPYGPQVERVIEHADSAGAEGGDPRSVGEKVWKVLRERRPAPVYSVGSGGPALIFGKRFIPRRQLERLIARRYGL
jgi:NAD(P)-dependent dehydrogenase (short-subunit alcohol dehydrogenase family)